jgi:hypothetical protein
MRTVVALTSAMLWMGIAAPSTTLSGCAVASGPAVPASNKVKAPAEQNVALSKPPELNEIVPASGPAGEAYPVEVTVRGTGFMPTGNVVEFGPVKIADAPSSEPGRITFSIPKSIPSGGEVPPRVLTPGEYRVTVTTKAGTSNALIFTLTRTP